MTSITMHDGRVVLHQADCRDVLRGLADNSIDSVVTDPPYALVSIQKRFGKPGSAPAKGNDAYMRASAGFMGANWDNGETAFSEEFWAEVLRVLKPGGHVVAFSGTRTYHRMAVAIEDAGFEIRDQLGWVYGSGFPKSHDVSKAVDRHLGAEREKVRVTNVRNPKATGGGKDGMDGASRPWIEAALERGYHEKAGDEPATPQSAEWQGWGTALKPAWEPIALARKPLIGTVAENVLAYGTGALNIDGCRVAYDMSDTNPATNPLHRKLAGYANGNAADTGSSSFSLKDGSGERNPNELGRWPANICHDGSDEVLAAFPDRDGASSNSRSGVGGIAAEGLGARPVTPGRNDSGSAARFFYCAKASRADRDAGLSGMATATVSDGRAVAADNAYQRGKTERANIHPTVKPTTLMQWLCRLVTPPGGIILDPFMGSGSTGKAAVLEGFQFIGCEREDEYMPIAVARIAWAIGASGAVQPEEPAVVAKQQPAAANDNRDLFEEVRACV